MSGGRRQLSQRFHKLRGEGAEEVLGLWAGVYQREVVVADVYELLGDGEVSGGVGP